ncbi:MAG: outer membrane beta-barrel protein [Bryobacteraceae bacterium]
MRPFLALLLIGGAAPAQPFSAGIKAGLPQTNLLDVVQTPDTTAMTNRYVFGPEVEVRLPHGLSIEFDALYRHFSYINYEAFAASTITTIGSAGNWEFPLVAKYRFSGKIVRPYVELGVAWDVLSGLKNTSSETPCSQVCENTNYPPTTESQRTVGVVVGGGIDIHAAFMHVAPGIRYTRWAQQYFNLDDDLHSSQNQVEFLVGFTF